MICSKVCNGSSKLGGGMISCFSVDPFGIRPGAARELVELFALDIIDSDDERGL